MKQALKWIAAIHAVLIGGALIYYFIIIDHSAKPYCHKQFEMALTIWANDHGGGDSNIRTNVFPNINGNSEQSLRALDQTMAATAIWSQGYRYVPGLRENDPGDLVLFYLEQPTRWIWHGQPQTIFAEKKWLIVPVDFAFFGDRRPTFSGEMSERLNPDQFKARLQKTLDFLRTNNRPNWQNVIAEHAKALQVAK
jgi:hypothetical protein